MHIEYLLKGTTICCCGFCYVVVSIIPYVITKICKHNGIKLYFSWASALFFLHVLSFHVAWCHNLCEVHCSGDISVTAICCWGCGHCRTEVQCHLNSQDYLNTIFKNMSMQFGKKMETETNLKLVILVGSLEKWIICNILSNLS